MKKTLQLILTAMLVLFVNEAFAQQGFGTNQPNKSSAVDIVSSKRGLLIPRVALLETTNPSPVTEPAESLFVYNTETEGSGDTAVTPGYYYWKRDNPDATGPNASDGQWIRFVASDTEKRVTVTAGENIKVDEDISTPNTTEYTVSVKGGTDGQVLVTKVEDGETSTVWIDPSDFIEGVVTASNGLSIETNTNDVILGGNLKQATVIKTRRNAADDAEDVTNTLAITGLEDVDTFDRTNQKIMVMDNNGILKVTTAAALMDAKDLTTDGVIVIDDGTNEYTTQTDAVLVETKLKIANESITSTHILNGTIQNEDLKEGAVSADKMTSHTTGSGTTDPAAVGMVPVADGAGNVTYQKVTADNIADGKALTSNSITVSPNGANALLADTQIDITPGTNAGDVLVTKVEGADTSTEWIPASELGNTVTADNGLNMDGNNNIQLGGELIEDTEIDATNNTLAVKGLKNSAASTANIVLEDETTGVLRKVARSLEYTASSDFNVGTQGTYNKFVPEITILATIGATDMNINLPTAADAKGQVINVKIANTTEPDAYVNIPNVDGVTIYGSMPYQGWIIKSNGTSWSVVGRM